MERQAVSPVSQRQAPLNVCRAAQGGPNESVDRDGMTEIANRKRDR